MDELDIFSLLQSITTEQWLFFCLILLLVCGFCLLVFSRHTKKHVSEWEARYEKLHSEHDIAIAIASERESSLLAQKSVLDNTIATEQLTIAELRKENTDSLAQLSALRTEIEQQKINTNEKLALLTENKQQLKDDFSMLAQKIFDDKQERFRQESKESLNVTLNPLREQLGEFRKRVDTVYDIENRERASLRQELNQLKDLNQKMSQDAINLTNALKGDKKMQGNWGEVILERVLEESGLKKGREYDTQVSLTDATGKRRAPDVVVRLPENKDIIIDAKVSLLDYERYCSAEDDIEKANALKAHVNAIKNHIDGLSFKSYESLEGIRSLDFVFIFIPIESAFMAAFETDQSAFRDAYEKNIIVVSPTTLLATLKTVQSIWRYERQNKNAELIAKQASLMYEKFSGFVKSLEDIGKHLERSQQSYDAAFQRLSRGRGNLLSHAKKLEALGVKVKKPIPQSVLDKGDDDDLVDENILSIPNSDNKNNS